VTRLLLAALLLAACAEEKPRAMAPPASPHVALEGVSLAEGTGERRVWSLEAQHIDYRPDGKVAALQNVKAAFYEKGALVSKGTAPAAQLRVGERRFGLSKVRISSPDEATGFESEDAAWRPDTGKLEAAGPVKYWRPIGKIEAGGLKADRALKQVQLVGGVHGILKVRP
jgi:LPS export ABC transporter protein LptC